MRRQFDNSRREFFEFETALDKEKPAFFNEEEKERQGLLEDLEELRRQDKEIDNIIRMGNEGYDAQRNGAMNLRKQRDGLTSVAKNTNAATDNLK
mmetsp:Transcript_30978/g.30518  ORF Transcript_30978/g.30518 Transcript_30978/m.30518 type:complete len:95 (+) Transcript_30978:231-515(+)